MLLCTFSSFISSLSAQWPSTSVVLFDAKQYLTNSRGILVFTVPPTHDMVSQLLSPTQPKNLSDLLVVFILGLHILALLVLPKKASIPLFAVVTVFWRLCYNVGIGYALREQSLYGSMVSWAKRTGIFEPPSAGKNKYSSYYGLLKREMELKLPRDYKFEEAPVEYNTWLLFRRVCDLILLCDFVAYCCFAAGCGGTPPGEFFGMTVARWVVGIGLILFNLWVKLDAHRVVKDFAWYWGDFFFLIDQDLTFDGVFEMAPHPMYSVGYVGLYGISLMAASYKVLFMSIFAHAAQFVFLTFVESPHIEKTYNPPPPRKQTSGDPTQFVDLSESGESDQSTEQLPPSFEKFTEPKHVRDIIGIDNIDLFRVVDVSTILLQFYMYAFALVTPSTTFWQALFVVNASLWRLWYSIGIGYLLTRQSNVKRWTRHFIKYGETPEEAWRQWKGIYHLSMTMCYASLTVAAYKMYSLPSDWGYGLALLRHVVGASLIALQMWTVVSIYDSLGEYGWFFGDFFFDQSSKLTYGGIYRFLNNPERIIGLAGVWGFAIITWSKSIFFLALLSHSLALCFIQFVERPHMQKRYGQSLRQHSGLSKSFKRSLPPPLRKWHGNVDRAIDGTADFVEDFIETARPRLAAGIGTFVKDTKALFKNYPARVSIARLAPDMAGFETKDYSISIEGSTSSHSQKASIDKVSGREGDLAQTPTFRGAHFQPSILEYGAPIKVRWTGPLHHSKRDWIGLYMLADNTSPEVTRVSSQGRWIATSKGIYEARADVGQLIADKQIIQWDQLSGNMPPDNGSPPSSPRNGDKGTPLMTGEMEFSGDKLWWTTGVFEFRYHHDGKHNVMSVSQPFEIRIARFDEDDFEEPESGAVKSAIEEVLLPIVRNCFDRDPEIAPGSVEEAFGGLVEREGKFAKRVVYAVRHM